MRLIDKDVIITEIEKRLNYRIESLKAINNGTFWKEEQSEDEFNKPLARCTFNAVKNELFELKCFLDTIEVKEVDLEHEVESYWKQCDMTWCRDAYSMTHIRSMLSNIAKHFYEHGMAASNKAQKGEEA